MGNHVEAPKQPKKISYNMHNQATLSKYSYFFLFHINYQFLKHITHLQEN